MTLTRSHAPCAQTWFGRLGSLAILGRYQTNQSDAGLALLRRFATVAVASGNVYESYDMNGKVGGDPGADYLEHCGGVNFAVFGGPFGIAFASDDAAAATIAPAFPPTWPTARAAFYLRGTLVCVEFDAARQPPPSQLVISAHGPPQRVRVTYAGATDVVVVSGAAKTPCE